MSEARELYYTEINKPWHKTRRAQIENYVSELEQQKSELMQILKDIRDYDENDDIEETRIANEIIKIIGKYK